MNYEIVTIEAAIVVGKSVHAENKDPEAMGQAIGGLWYQFDTYAKKIRHTVDNNAIGLYTNFTGDYRNPSELSYDVVAGMRVEQVANDIDGFESYKILAGTYAKFSIVGNLMEAPAALWQTIWQTELNRICLTDFEVYYPGESRNDMLIEIYIGINE